MHAKFQKNWLRESASCKWNLLVLKNWRELNLLKPHFAFWRKTKTKNKKHFVVVKKKKKKKISWMNLRNMCSCVFGQLCLIFHVFRNKAEKATYIYCSAQKVVELAVIRMCQWRTEIMQSLKLSMGVRHQDHQDTITRPYSHDTLIMHERVEELSVKRTAANTLVTC